MPARLRGLNSINGLGRIDLSYSQKLNERPKQQPVNVWRTRAICAVLATTKAAGIKAFVM